MATRGARGRVAGDAGAREARAALIEATAPRQPVRRRWGRVSAGVAAVVLGAWAGASLVVSTDETVEVVALANDVGRFETIERSDLRVARLPAGSDLASVPAASLSSLVGRVAASDLAAGGLLAEAQLVPVGQRLVGDGEAVVGAVVGPDDAPATGLVRGADVVLVMRPPAGATDAGLVEVEGWVVEVRSEASATGGRPIEVAVARAEAGRLSAAAADGRLSVVVLGSPTGAGGS